MQLYPDLAGEIGDEITLEAVLEIVNFRARMTLREVFSPMPDNVDPLLNYEFEAIIQTDDAGEWQSYFHDTAVKIMDRRLKNPQLRLDVIDIMNDSKIKPTLLPNEERMLETALTWALSIHGKSIWEDAIAEKSQARIEDCP